MALQEDYTGDWRVLTYASPAAIGAQFDTHGFHVADIDIHEGSQPPRFSVILLRNRPGGAYWWYYGLTGNQVGARLDEHKAVPASLVGYATSGGTRFAVAMRRAPTQGYWWYFGQTAARVGELLRENNAVPEDISAYHENGRLRFAVVMTPGKGRSYGWYYGQTPADVSRLLRETRGRLHLLRAYATASGTRYVVVIHAPNSERFWWYWGQTPADIRRNALFNASYPTSLSTYTENGRHRYACVMRERPGQTTNKQRHRRVRDLIERSQKGGYYGFLLRRIGGPVIEAFNETVVFDPCSALKALPHAHALRAVQDRLKVNGHIVTLDSQVSVPEDQAGNCPFTDPGDPAAGWQSGTLRDALRRSMQNSSNVTPEAVRLFFGKANVAATAGRLGMRATRHLGATGCISNETTCADLASLYDRCATGFLDAGHWATFRELALEGGMLGQVETVCGQVAAELSLPAGFAGRYRNRCRAVFKNGGGNDGANHKLVTAGHVALPWCTSQGLRWNDYVYAVFSEHNTGYPEIDYLMVVAEMLRNEITASVRSIVNGGCTL